LRTKEILCTLHISAFCRPDDGRVTTETCCLNESKIRPPVIRLN